MFYEPLYLFHCPGSPLYAIAHEQTGCLMRRRLPDNAWLLRAEIVRSEVPQGILLSVNQWGYCLLDEYEIKTTRSQWLLRS